MTDSENIVSFPDLKVIEEEAALWIARLDTRDLSKADLEKLYEWKAISIQHSDALERMAALWGGADVLDELNYISDDFEIQESPSMWRIERPIVMVAIAASFMFVFGALVYQLSGSGQDEGQLREYATVVGEQETISLADGSSLILNTDSAVAIEMSDDNRIVRLIKGEAHFDVESDPSRPFLVYAGEGIVKAVGTAFTVHLQKKAVEVTVSEGVVALISQPDMTLALEEVPIAELKPLAALTAGQNAVFSREVEHVESMSDEALGRKLLWRDGFIAFTGEPLVSVVADVSRYTDVVIEIEDEGLESLPVGGYFKVGEIEGMFEALETSFGVQVKRVSSSHVILSHPS